ncbi:hypothetical protein So717_39420 [Roseobacter cerasinus]|uniref:DUF2125 domain-containing protein n=1 Tax=Roseobacter cerasinus TaxID=2602289 RepID=A0A640VVZ1_9RHOB|nr:DUF2125 domain-containing protein [Roseobacter cerasinus]GFE52189.1 hypothetical protein So717_39420 [Roseobacter cerasinus]
MRRILWAAVVLALAWSGWWIWAANAVQVSTDAWFSDRRIEGWQADYGTLDVRGFPLRFDARMTLPALADPDTGIALSASGVDVAAPAWQPGQIAVVLPEDAITLSSPQARATLQVTAGRVALEVRPRQAMALEHLRLAAEAWSLAAPQGVVLQAEDLHASFVQSETEALRYTLTASARALQPGPVPRAALRVPDSWPVSFDSFALDMQLRFDRPWDRTAVEVARPQPRHIKLDLAEAIWGTLELRAAADLQIDAEGVPAGSLSLQARNWQDMLALAERAGVVHPTLTAQAQNVLQALARATGDPRAIDVTLTLRDGLVWLGFVPLGPAPRLILR